MVQLAGGLDALGMILRRERPALELSDITGFGGWRAYLARA